MLVKGGQGNKPSPEPMLTQVYVVMWRLKATMS